MSHEPVPDPECLISTGQIVERVQELGEQIMRDSAGKTRTLDRTRR